MSSREAILASVRANLPKAKPPLPAPSLFDENPPPSLLETFRNSLTRMGGRVVDPGPAGDPLAPARALIAHSRLVCSATPEIAGGLDLAAIVEPRDLADVDHAVARAVFGVAETGSVLLTDETLKVNALAYLAQHLVVLLDPSDIVANLHNAYARPEVGERPTLCSIRGLRRPRISRACSFAAPRGSARSRSCSRPGLRMGLRSVRAARIVKSASKTSVSGRCSVLPNASAGGKFRRDGPAAGERGFGGEGAADRPSTRRPRNATL